MDWLYPQVFLILVCMALPTIGLGLWLAERKTRKAKGIFCSPNLWQKMENNNQAWRLLTKRVFFVGAVVLILLALARPQGGISYEEVNTEGLNILIALDTSSSMKAMDFQPGNRLEAAKLVLSSFIRNLKGDRAGLIVFAGGSFVQCPLTMDHDTLLMLLDHVDFNTVEHDGTAIGDAIETAVNAFGKEENRSAVLLLLTDGENNQGVDPIGAAQKAAKNGIRIFTVGIGTPGGAKIPEGYDMWGRLEYKRFQGQEVVTTLDEALLKKIASLTGGEYTFASSTDALAHVARRIQTLQKSVFKTKRRKQSEDLYPYFVAGALALLLLELIFHLISLKIPGFSRLGFYLIMVFVFFSSMGMGIPAYLDNRSGNKMFSQQDLENARDRYMQAINEDPNFAESYYNLGNVFYRQGNFDQAIENYENSLAKKSGLFEACYNEGNAYYKEMAWEKAVGCYEKALTLRPDDEDAKYNLNLARKKLKSSPNEQHKDKEQKKSQKNSKDQGKQGKSKDEKQNQEEQGSQGQESQKQGQPKYKKMTESQMKELEKIVKNQSKQYESSFHPEAKKGKQQKRDMFSQSPEDQIDQMRQMMGLPPIFGGRTQDRSDKKGAQEEKNW